MAFGRRKIPEHGITIKTSRVSYISNYFLVALVVALLVLVWPHLNLKIFFASYTDLIPFAIFSLLVVTITFLMEEPSIEQVMRKYIITNNEVIKVEGLIRKKRISIPHGNVADIRVKKGVWGRLLNFGDLEISGMKENIVMKGIRNPDEIYKVIENKISLMREGFIKQGRKGKFGTEAIGIESSQDLNE